MPNQAASALAAMRKRSTHTCIVCGTSFVAISTARYCSNACRQRAKRERAGQAGKAKP